MGFAEARPIDVKTSSLVLCMYNARSTELHTLYLNRYPCGTTELHTLHLNRVLVLPGRKGTRVRVVYCRKYAVFMPIFARITARYRPKPFISGAIENKVKEGAL